MNIPSDSAMLLSLINTKLRDYYPSLSSLCEDLDLEEQVILDKLAAIDYHYSPLKNQFI